MKKILLGMVAAVVLGLALTPGQASAGWVYQTKYRWDPYCCKYIAYQDRCWVPDPCGPVCGPYSNGYLGNGYGPSVSLYGNGGFGNGYVGFGYKSAPFHRGPFNGR